MAAIQGIIDLMEISEYPIKYFLLYIHRLLGQIGFKGGGLRPSAGAEPVEGVVELSRRCQAEIKYPCKLFPSYSHQAYHAEVHVTHWYQDGSMAGGLLLKVFLETGGLEQVNNPLP